MLLATTLALMTIDGRGSGPIQSARGVVVGVTSPLRSLIGWAFSPIGDAWTGAVHYDNVVEENAELRARVAELEGSIAQLPDLESELDEIRSATALEFGEGLPTAAAEVVEDRNTGVERIITINRGSADGIEPFMAVVTGRGLVGRIIQVNSEHRAVVRLVTDGRMNVGVIVARTGAQGVASGTGDGRDLELDLTAGDQGEVRTGDIAHTTGFDSSKYPGEIPIGEITVADSGAITVTPLADLDRLSFVTVLLVVPENP